MNRAASLTVGVVAALAVAAALASPAAAQTPPPPCPDMPPDLVSATDDAIETREQGQRDVTICLAVTGRLDALDARTTERLDFTGFGVWATVGVLFALLVAPMMQAAFRWWRE